MKVTVIGTGYVGLTTGICLAYIGHEVVCADTNESKVRQLRDGHIPIYEYGLPEMLAASGERIRFTAQCRQAVGTADIVILAVGTPAKAEGAPELAYLYAAMETVLDGIAEKQTPTLVVNKSTVPVGTGDKLAAMAASRGISHRVEIASNPEFLRQGSAMPDTLYPERIVAGGSPTAQAALKELYGPLLRQDFSPPALAPRPPGLASVPFFAVDLKSAELGKYAANAFLAMKISFINEMANLCDRVGADVSEIAGILGSDSRIGKAFLQAGIGYGGSCFPKDTKALHHIAGTSGYDFKLLSSVIEVNRFQKYVLVGKLRSALGALDGRRVTILGLTFKPETDDMREAPSLPIIEALLAEGACVTAHDPVGLPAAKALLPAEAKTTTNLDEALQDADAAVLVTEWPVYLNYGGRTYRQRMRQPIFVDGRNALPVSDRGWLDYYGVGMRALPSAALST
ncbi:UDP-glucose dehydrogenase family protein [Cohnella hashimotonis]|uniref:UDP-glucose 6-dehydrogenase n=1 Tax=Cohnella hashimotonis TaxID=2826895 RepID=A0ABT6TBE5_9BACL|nr:UDP-glucose/GDP-mannose dehydrogenase family protein [Cohnella hashimotonis]MDI4644158.1 UDP-glucose/GDP-mannose dehydrogenase family protein [Cohnella hashimotonis]